MNAIQLSRIVDVTKENVHHFEGDPIVSPFVPVFVIEGYEYILLKEDGLNYTASFTSANAAWLAAEEFLKTFKYEAVVLRKEGRFFKLFRSVTAAENFVSRQNREWLSDLVCRKLQFGLNVYGGAYGSVNWDMYDIDLVCFEN